MPDQISGNLQWAQGVATTAIGTLIGSPEQQQEGRAKMQQGNAEVEAAKAQAYAEASSDNIAGKIESGVGILTGNQEKQTEGNLKSQKAEMKQAANDPAGVSAYIPNSLEDAQQRLSGKAESAVGMLTGDQEKQASGNMKDASANAHDTVNKLVSS